MSQVGVLPAPTGVTANFDDGYSSLQITLIVVNAVTYFFATLFMCLRFYTSAFINKRTELGDFLLFASWGVGAASFAYTVAAVQYGFGKHAWDVEVTEIMGYYEKLTAMAITYFWTPSLTKLSLLTLFYRVNTAKWGRILTWCLGTAILTYTVVLTALIAGPCNPLKPTAITCVNNLGTSQAALNIASDIIIIIMPIPLVHSLQMPTKQKISVGVLMTLGSFCVVASIGRVAFVTALANNPDITWTQAKVGVWSAFELNIGIMCVSMARLKPFVQRHFPTFIAFNSSTNNSSSYKDSLSKPNNSWRRPNNSYNTYELHSVQHSSVTPAPQSPSPALDSKQIRIKTDYYVSRSKKEQDSTSLDMIWNQSKSEWT